MGLFSNNQSCPPGQRFSLLFDSCVPEDASGGTATTSAGNVPVKDETTEGSNGKFWDRAPEYIDSLASLWGAIKGQPVQYGDGTYQPNYQPQKDNTSTILTISIFVLLFIMIFVLFALRRKK